MRVVRSELAARFVKAPSWGFFVSANNAGVFASVTASGGNGVGLTARQQELQALLEPTVVALGFDLWGIEYAAQGKHSVLRIFIDAQSGVTVDDCAAVSAQVSAVLDVEDPITGEYTLEVSSPGVDRLLFRLEQFPPFFGEWIEVRLRRPFEGRRNFKGILQSIEGDEVVVRVDDHEYLLPYGAVDKARVHPRIEGAASVTDEATND
ncbi:MAG TPA: ribosome maturation factor RimP [Halieaceae bacterium]|nr:ribosome maturation factor RimP [Haliea sp.]HAN68803.1 ribosome maturation factor RimP [Halieaceae bacterium]MAY93084.1 ribosome maturation factor RimP [Haliea sp.]MBK39713.1 ribosome maturation factor RimP [Haliea sp.]MBP69494.1 ribosome maturation factor RimP [Haliea sp.]